LGDLFAWRINRGLSPVFRLANQSWSVPSIFKAIRDATNGGFALGSERFQRQIASIVGRRTWPGRSGRPRKEAPDDDQLKLPN
jgi:hypothetical protein